METHPEKKVLNLSRIARSPPSHGKLSTGRLLGIIVLIVLGSVLSRFSCDLWAIKSDFSTFKRVTNSYNPLDAGHEWKDDTWPFRNQTPWDISTDYPYTRLIEYDVTEGTWLRLDVHPKTGDIVFDMLGDLYCLSGDVYLAGISGTPNRANPILLGVPHDSDPHFSPDGNHLAFRSDAELGVENIWLMGWNGCESMNIRPKNAEEALLDALETKRHEDALLARGVKETPDRKQRRLIREGRAGAHRITNETFRWVSDPRFHPSGDKIVATKWYTSRSTAGAGEGWEYDIPKSINKKIDVGAGRRLVSRTLPPGWSPEEYGDVNVGPEQFIWSGNDGIIYAKNMIDVDGHWAYNKDIHSGIYAIFSTNLTSRKTSTLVDSFPGGASRPELSRDRRTLAFVRRVRDKEALVLKDLVTGTIHHIWHGLTYDSTTVYAPMGTYPSFAFTPNDNAIIIWAAGQIYHVPLTTNSIGERVSAGDATPISFLAHVEQQVATTITHQTDILRLGTQDSQRILALTELRANNDGSKVVFQAAGTTYVHTVKADRLGHSRPVPVLHQEASYFSPSFVPGTDELVIHARWSDITFTTFELANITSGKAYELTGLSLGRYYSPILSGSTGVNKIAFIKTSGDTLTGNVVATAGAGLYVGAIDLPPPPTSRSISITNLRFIAEEPSLDYPAHTKLMFLEEGARILVQQPQRSVIINIASDPDAFSEYDVEEVAQGRMTTEMAIIVLENTVHAAVVDFHHVYLAPNITAQDVVWSKPGHATKNLARLSVDGGHDVIWSGDGKKLLWFLGPLLHSVQVANLTKCSTEIASDALNFGITCTKGLLDINEVFIESPTSSHRLKQDALARLPACDAAARANADVLVITNATVLTMDTGNILGDVLHNATLFTRSGSIEALIRSQEEPAIPQGAKVINAEGGYVLPGFIDVHAHWNIFTEFFPAQSWELLAFLAYGVTTLHNPSGDNVRGFWERSRVESGRAIAPRIFQVGNAVFAGAWEGIHEEITTMEEAYSALLRIKAEGGPASFSYKNYDLPSRASRQRLLLAARNLSMLCFPEGGMNFDWDQTYIVDGMTTIEHAVPIPVLYDDVMKLFALSGTGYTPTHVVNYGGVWGEQHVWATEDIPNDPKLRRFVRHDILESLSESTTRPKNSYALFNTSESTAKMVRMGLKAHIGAHGEQPMGLLYHAEMFFAKQGGLSNYEVFRAATSDAAKTLGIFSAVGSVSPGKLADLVIFPPGFSVLEDDIERTRDIRYVVRGGRVWEAETMAEVWPNKGKRPVLPPLNPE